MGLGLVGFGEVSEAEGQVKCSPTSLGSGQLLLGQQELLFPDTTASASSPAMIRFTVVRQPKASQRRVVSGYEGSTSTLEFLRNDWSGK